MVQAKQPITTKTYDAAAYLFKTYLKNNTLVRKAKLYICILIPSCRCYRSNES